MTAAPVLDLKGMALLNYEQDFSPADDIFSCWYNPDYHPERFTFFLRDAATAGTAVMPLAQCGVNSLGNSFDGSTGQWSSYSTSPFQQSGGFCFSDTLQITEQIAIQDIKTSATQHTSPCSIEPQVTEPVPICSPKMTSFSPPALKTEPSSSDDTKTQTIIEPAPRKRGRPRINRDRTFSSSSSIDGTSTSTSVRHPGRLPHKQIERKYREGLNLEIERLRKAVPTLLQSTDSSVIGVAKPSKGMVLAAAISYILKIEQERDSAIDEIERLGGNVRVGKLIR